VTAAGTAPAWPGPLAAASLVPAAARHTATHEELVTSSCHSEMHNAHKHKDLKWCQLSVEPENQQGMHL
jgi:hypothetical protein